jgi:hypothetical protein
MQFPEHGHGWFRTNDLSRVKRRTVLKLTALDGAIQPVEPIATRGVRFYRGAFGVV